MSPLTAVRSNLFFEESLSYSIALISDFVSMIPKILSAAAIAFPISGPKAAAVPAYEAPNIIAMSAIMISSILISGLDSMIIPAP
jgi:hypothetical protein